jgi:hypothetical protein
VREAKGARTDRKTEMKTPFIVLVAAEKEKPRQKTKEARYTDGIHHQRREYSSLGIVDQVFHDSSLKIT